MCFLAGDIGGTNTRLIYFKQTSAGRQIIAETFYKSQEFVSFEIILTKFLTDNNLKNIDAACLAVAGPVHSGNVSVTNLPWLLSEEKLKNELNTSCVLLINDFIAVAYGLCELNNNDFLTLQSVESTSTIDVNKDAVVIGAGTGLGVSHLIYMNGKYKPLPSETGHVSFSAHNKQQCDLLSWLFENEKHVSLESILSGRGLFTIYQFLKHKEGICESEIIKNKFVDSDPAQVITEYALADTDALCVKTLETFIEIYGAAASDIVLHYYPVSNLYIAGGIAVKIANQMTNGKFIDAFVNKGLMTSNMENITIKLIIEEKAGLMGAMAKAVSLLD